MEASSNFAKHTNKNPIQRFLINNFYKKAFQLLRDLSINNVLEVGCGEGFFLSRLEKNGVGNYLEGVDFSENAVSMGKEQFPKLTLKRGNIYDLSYENKSFDLIVCSEVLEHLENPVDALSEVERVARKYCMFSVPNEPFFRGANFLRGKNISRWGNDEGHIQYWGSSGFKEMIKTKFDVIDIKHPFPWILILAKKKKEGTKD